MIWFLVGLVVGFCLGGFAVALGVEMERRKIEPTLLAYVNSTAELSACLKTAQWYAVRHEPTEMATETRH